MDRYDIHPDLFDKSPSYLARRSTFPIRYAYPSVEQISFYGDIRLYCTPPQYQHVLDTVPGAQTVGEGLKRKIVPMWPDLDWYRDQVAKWHREQRLSFFSREEG